MTPGTILQILVVEDDPVVASQLTCFLTGLGWKVDFAASGKLAIRLSKAQRYDAILLDVAMPDLPGAEILAQIKQACDSPVLLMNPGQDPAGNAAFAAADDSVPDPTDYRDIVSRCQRFATQEPLAITA